jgi:general secretion pathway protein D
VVTGSVQYLDVGLKLDIEPQVHAEADVGIKLNLEVSNIAKEIPGPNGSLAYQIGTRSAQTSLRLRDGETQVLAGLLNDSERSSGSKVPGLGQLPVLGKLFGSERRDAGKTEIVLSITPRIVRPFGASSAVHRNVSTGTEATVRATPLNLEPVGRVSVEPAADGASAGRMSPALGTMPTAPTRRPSARIPTPDAGGGQ